MVGRTFGCVCVCVCESKIFLCVGSAFQYLCIGQGGLDLFNMYMLLSLAWSFDWSFDFGREEFERCLVI